jgi:hypothetical protein
MLGQFVIRRTQGSGITRVWTYLKTDGTFTQDIREAAHFPKRQEGYKFVRDTFGESRWSCSLSAVRH